MAGWQEELAELLRELGVMQEEPQTNLRSTGKPVRRDTRWHLHPNKLVRHLADIPPSNDSGSDDGEASLMDLGAMRREVDSIVRQITRLTQNGELDQLVKEDILEVLSVLQRFSAVAQQVASGDEAYLESISALLRFCRLVVRFSETTIEDL